MQGEENKIMSVGGGIEKTIYTIPEGTYKTFDLNKEIALIENAGPCFVLSIKDGDKILLSHLAEFVITDEKKFKKSLNSMLEDFKNKGGDINKSTIELMAGDNNNNRQNVLKWSKEILQRDVSVDKNYQNDQNDSYLNFIYGIKQLPCIGRKGYFNASQVFEAYNCSTELFNEQFQLLSEKAKMFDIAIYKAIDEKNNSLWQKVKLKCPITRNTEKIHSQEVLQYYHGLKGVPNSEEYNILKPLINGMFRVNNIDLMLNTNQDFQNKISINYNEIEEKEQDYAIQIQKEKNEMRKKNPYRIMKKLYVHAMKQPEHKFVAKDFMDNSITYGMFRVNNIDLMLNTNQDFQNKISINYNEIEEKEQDYAIQIQKEKNEMRKKNPYRIMKKLYVHAMKQPEHKFVAKDFMDNSITCEAKDQNITFRSFNTFLNKEQSSTWSTIEGQNNSEFYQCGHFLQGIYASINTKSSSKEITFK